MEPKFISTHKLDFEVSQWDGQLNEEDNWMLFRVGTCEGVWKASEKNYSILAIVNSEPGNGHFTDVLEWFENSCKRDGKNLQILEVWNEPFKKHLITKKGFRVIPMTDHVVKDFRDRAIRIGKNFAVASIGGAPLHAQSGLKNVNDIIAETYTYKVTNIRKPLVIPVIKLKPNPFAPARTPRSIRREQESKVVEAPKVEEPKADNESPNSNMMGTSPRIEALLNLGFKNEPHAWVKGDEVIPHGVINHLPDDAWDALLKSKVKQSPLAAKTEDVAPVISDDMNVFTYQQYKFGISKNVPFKKAIEIKAAIQKILA